MMKLYTGCSGYATPSWKNLFYPDTVRKKDWFDYYSKHFNTYEFNGSFYKFPTVENLLSWHDKTGDDFTFSIKVPRIITHNKKLQQCDQEIEDFYNIIKEGFRNKLAGVLWQLPPGFSFSEERLASVIRVMNPHFKNVVEFRHESWWQQHVFTLLRENNITFCNVNYPKLPATLQQTTSTGYVRMHGNPKLFYSEYSKEDIEKLYDEIIHADFDEAYIYFNNTASTAGIINAVQFKALTI
jgi:uncharacterized protein YecE (DUF72 family)